MFAFFVVVHIVLCVALILVVLLQAGKGGGLAGAFGGGGTAQTLFGGRGAATFLSKATSWLAVAFMGMSILLAVLSSRGTTREGLLQQRARERAAQSQLPPSSSSFTPGTQDTAAAGLFPPGATPGQETAPPAAAGTSTPAAAGQAAGQAPAPAAGKNP